MVTDRVVKKEDMVSRVPVATAVVAKKEVMARAPVTTDSALKKEVTANRVRVATAKAPAPPTAAPAAAHTEEAATTSPAQLNTHPSTTARKTPPSTTMLSINCRDNPLKAKTSTSRTLFRATNSSTARMEAPAKLPIQA